MHSHNGYNNCKSSNANHSNENDSIYIYIHTNILYVHISYTYVNKDKYIQINVHMECVQMYTYICLYKYTYIYIHTHVGPGGFWLIPLHRVVLASILSVSVAIGTFLHSSCECGFVCVPAPTAISRSIKTTRLEAKTTKRSNQDDKQTQTP